MLVLVVFPRSRVCLLHENDNGMLFEMVATVPDQIKCQRSFREGKIAAAQHCGTAFPVKQGKQGPPDMFFFRYGIRGKQLYHLYLVEILPL